MPRKDRAKQFAPFDALKGLQEALRLKEYQHDRTIKGDIPEEKIEAISKTLLELEKDDLVEVQYFYDGYYKTLIGSGTPDLARFTRDADILIAAIGKPCFITGDMIKPGAAVIDVGINRITDAEGKSKLVGDVDFDSAVEVAGAITPVPGGVGPMTIAMLMDNAVRSAERDAAHA